MIPPAQAEPRDRLEAPLEREVITTLGRRSRQSANARLIWSAAAAFVTINLGRQNDLMCAVVSAGWGHETSSSADERDVDGGRSMSATAAPAVTK